MNPRRTVAVFQKECRHILRDPRSLIMALVLPMFLMLLFGYALNLDVDRIPTLVFDQDHTAQSRTLIRQFYGSRFFQIQGLVDDYAAIEKGFDSGGTLMALVIPPKYAQRVAAGDRTNVQILLDGSDSNTASIALGYTDAVIQGYARELGSEDRNRKAGLRIGIPVQPDVRVLYNGTLESKNYVVPGLIAVILTIIAALLSSLTIAREWEMGTMEQLISTPVRPAEIVLGKMLAFFVVGAIDSALSVLTSIYVFDVPFRGNVFFLAATICVFISGSLFWGILLSAVAQSQLLAFQMGILSSFLPSFMLSGFIYAVENMPSAIQAITRVVPTRYFVTILKGIFLKGVGLEILWSELSLLIAFSAAVFLLSTRKLKQKLA